MKIARHQRAAGAMALYTEQGSWTYEDPDEHHAALRLLLEHGVSLAKIDDWIEAQKWDTFKQLARVMGWRRRMINNMIGDNGEAAEGWGMFLMSLAHINRREAFIHPKAVQAIRQSEAQAKRRKDKPASMDDHDAARNKRMRQHHARLVEQNHRSPTGQTAADFSVSRSTVQRVLRNPTS